jgi:hypothetical protein
MTVSEQKEKMAEKKESKNLQNEATKPCRINETVRKMGQNEAKRSETLSGLDPCKSLRICEGLGEGAREIEFEAKLGFAVGRIVARSRILRVS